MSNNTVREAQFWEFLEENPNATTFYPVQVITLCGLSLPNYEIIFGCWENLRVTQRKLILYLCKRLRILFY